MHFIATLHSFICKTMLAACLQRCTHVPHTMLAGALRGRSATPCEFCTDVLQQQHAVGQMPCVMPKCQKESITGPAALKQSATIYVPPPSLRAAAAEKLGALAGFTILDFASPARALVGHKFCVGCIDMIHPRAKNNPTDPKDPKEKKRRGAPSQRGGKGGLGRVAEGGGGGGKKKKKLKLSEKVTDGSQWL